MALGLTTERDIRNLIFLRWIELLRSYDWPGPLFYARGAPGFAAARNIVIKQAWERFEEWDALLFWDSDQLPPMWFPWPKHSNVKLPGWETMAPLGNENYLAYLDRLLRDNPDKEVVAGIYFSRDLGFTEEPPFEPLAYASVPGHDDEPDGFRRLAPSELGPMLHARGLYPVAGAGTGSMLIRKSVLVRLAEAKGLTAWLEDTKRKPAPMFEQQQLRSGQQAGLQWTEDLYFCWELTHTLDPPVQLWLDTIGESAHQTDLWASSEHYLQARGMYAGGGPEDKARQERVRRAMEEQGRPKLWVPGT